MNCNKFEFWLKLKEVQYNFSAWLLKKIINIAYNVHIITKEIFIVKYVE